MAPHLLTIPEELRHQIYSYVIVNKAIIRVPTQHVRRTFDIELTAKLKTVRSSFALMLVSKHMTAEVEPLLNKKNWTHFKGSFLRKDDNICKDQTINDRNRRRNVRARKWFFGHLLRLNTTFRVARLSLLMTVLPALLAWLADERKDISSLSEFIFYDDCYDVDYGSDDSGDDDTRTDADRIAADGEILKRALLDKVESLVSLGHGNGGFLPNKLGVVIHFEIFVDELKRYVAKLAREEDELTFEFVHIQNGFYWGEVDVWTKAWYDGIGSGRRSYSTSEQC